ncbi:hypothetical protein [Nonomuraea sp. NPDC001831]|uniref:hypothetical protein n=1 Tax=Nonomuraea sp. NPDC001831 TaxID=3364340 RepID=UPI0036A5232A
MGLVRGLSVRGAPGPVRVGAVLGRMAAVMAAVPARPAAERSVGLLVGLLEGRSVGPRGSGRSWSGGRSPGWP